MVLASILSVLCKQGLEEVFSVVVPLVVLNRSYFINCDTSAIFTIVFNSDPINIDNLFAAHSNITFFDYD